ncbi:MAG: polysaccharide deacetylase family protein [Clostridia bacterium]|nr:polysaccharide deacetylase family protein [Clostridia bacterium]
MVKKLYKDGKAKTVTFSYDDGTAQDVRLVKLFNKYGLKCTFNFIAGKCDNACFMINDNGKCSWDKSDALRECFKGHEIANHSLTHPNLPKLSDEECRKEILEAKKILEENFGYEVRGFVAPGGDWNEHVLDIMRECGVVYNRISTSNFEFTLPEDFLKWDPTHTGHYFLHEHGKQVISDFLTTKTELACLYIYGHSYEFNIMHCYNQESWADIPDRWGYFEELVCRRLAFKDDIWYATNIEIYDYVTAMRKAEIGDTYIINPTDTELFFDVNGEVVSVKPNTRFDF